MPRGYRVDPSLSWEENVRQFQQAESTTRSVLVENNPSWEAVQEDFHVHAVIDEVNVIVVYDNVIYQYGLN